MNEKRINDIVDSAVEALSINLQVDFGTIEDFELFLSREENDIPCMWILPHEQGSNPIASSNAMIDTINISGILLTDTDIDQTTESRKKNAEFADSLIDSFVSNINSNDLLSITSVSKSPLYRANNRVAQGKAFVIVLTMPKRTQCC